MEKKLILELDESIFCQLKDAVHVARMVGNDVGILWEFAFLVWKAIENGDTELVIIPREEKDKKGG